MGAYAVYSDKPFISNGKIVKKRKRNSVVDKNCELLKNSRLVIDEKKQKIIILKDEK